MRLSTDSFIRFRTNYLIAGIRYLKNGERIEPAPVNQRENTNPHRPPKEHKKEGWGNLCLLKGKDLFHWEYVGHLLDPQPEFSEEFYEALSKLPVLENLVFAEYSPV